jgi:cardiolipin synthase
VLSAVGGDGKVSPIRTAYELAIEKAVARVWITQPYFTPDKAFLESLRGAAARGVDVRIIVPATSDSTVVLHSSRYHYSPLLQSGVRIFEHRDAMLHAKTAVVDGIWSTVGSSNLDYRSFLHNDEVNAVIVGDDFGKQLEARFEADQTASEEITLADWRKRGPISRAKEFCANVIAYWL